MSNVRRCRKCGEEYPLTKDYFGHQPNGSYRYTCRSCIRRNTKRHYDANPYRVIERAGLRSSSVFSALERQLMKRRIVLRDGGFFCFYCKRDLDSSYHIDHKVPVAMGGEHNIDNFVLACMQCNQEKHSKSIDQYRAWLHERGEKVKF